LGVSCSPRGSRGVETRQGDIIWPRRGEAGRLVVVVQLAIVGVVVDRSIVVLPAAFRLRFLVLMVVDVLGARGDGSSFSCLQQTWTVRACC
jgi:hypothetical protein